jgi:hypothetical protein
MGRRTTAGRLRSLTADIPNVSLTRTRRRIVPFDAITWTRPTSIATLRRGFMFYRSALTPAIPAAAYGKLRLNVPLSPEQEPALTA